MGNLGSVGIILYIFCDFIVIFKFVLLVYKYGNCMVFRMLLYLCYLILIIK